MNIEKEDEDKYMNVKINIWENGNVSLYKAFKIIYI